MKALLGPVIEMWWNPPPQICTLLLCQLPILILQVKIKHASMWKGTGVFVKFCRWVVFCLGEGTQCSPYSITWVYKIVFCESLAQKGYTWNSYCDT